MAGIGSFDATNINPREAFEPVPINVYKVQIVNSDCVPTKSGNGGYIAKFEADILEGQFAGRKVFHQINIKNPNPKCQEIGEREMSALCHGAGKLKIQDTTELHYIPMYWKLGIEPGTDQYEAKNIVKAVYHLSDPKAHGNPGEVKTIYNPPVQNAAPPSNAGRPHAAPPAPHFPSPVPPPANQSEFRGPPVTTTAAAANPNKPAWER